MRYQEIQEDISVSHFGKESRTVQEPPKQQCKILCESKIDRSGILEKGGLRMLKEH